MTIAPPGAVYNVPMLHEPTTAPHASDDRIPGAYASAYIAPQHHVRETPEIQRKMHQLYDWLGESMRLLAKVIDTSHPTVSALLRGESDFLLHNTAQRQRLDDAYEVIWRVSLLTSHDDTQTTEVLFTALSTGKRPVDYLIEARYDSAYLAALDAIRPPRRGGLMDSTMRMRPGASTVPILDEDVG